MKEEIVKILEKLRDEDLAMIIAGQLDRVNLSREDFQKISDNREIAALVATEIIARRKGFRVEETELLRIKTHGEYVQDVPLYKYEGKYYVIYGDRILQIPLKEEAPEPQKPRKRPGKGGIKLP